MSKNDQDYISVMLEVWCLTHTPVLLRFRRVAVMQSQMYTSLLTLSEGRKVRETYILVIIAMQVGLNGQVNDREDVCCRTVASKFPPFVYLLFFSYNLILDSFHLQDAIPTTFTQAKKSFQENCITPSERYPGLAWVVQILCCAQGTRALSCTS